MAPYEYRASVVRVIDGDTLKLDIDLGFSIAVRDVSIRILGINAREHSEPGGIEAFGNLALLLPPGAQVLARTVKPDKFGGRWLAALKLASGQELSDLLIAQQWAAPWDGSGPKPRAPWPRTL